MYLKAWDREKRIGALQGQEDYLLRPPSQERATGGDCLLHNCVVTAGS